MNGLTQLKLSVQRALLGEVTPNSLAVTCGIRNSKIVLRAYFDDSATNEETERIDVVSSEIIADFPDFDISEEVIFAARNERVEVLDFWASLRSGTLQTQD